MIVGELGICKKCSILIKLSEYKKNNGYCNDCINKINNHLKKR